MKKKALSKSKFPIFQMAEFRTEFSADDHSSLKKKYGECGSWREEKLYIATCMANEHFADQNVEIISIEAIMDIEGDGTDLTLNTEGVRVYYRKK